MRLQNCILAAKQALLKEIEGPALIDAPMTDIIVAILGLTVEAGAILVLTLPAGVPIALGAAALPLFINITAAYFQSTYYEIPDACADWLPRYEEHLLSDTIPALNALEIVRYQASVQYLITAHHSPDVRSVGQAKGRAQMTFAQDRIAELENQGFYAITQCQKAHQAKTKALTARCPDPQVDIRGLTAAEATQAKEAWKQAWVEAETAKLEADHHAELEDIQINYGRAIAFWRQKEAQGGQEYRDYEPPDGHPTMA